MTKATDDWKIWGMQSDPGMYLPSTICNTCRNGKVRIRINNTEQAEVKYVQ